MVCLNPSCVSGGLFSSKHLAPRTLLPLAACPPGPHGDPSERPAASEAAAPRLRAATCCLLCGSGAEATQSCLYLEERQPAAGEGSGKSLSIRAGKCKCNSPGRLKSSCSETEGSLGACSSPPRRGHAGCGTRHSDSVHPWVYPARSKPWFRLNTASAIGESLLDPLEVSRVWISEACSRGAPKCRGRQSKVWRAVFFFYYYF